jgi:hypothetical protein
MFTADARAGVCRLRSDGQSAFAFRVGVGNNEGPVTEVRGTDGCCWYAIPRCIVPERGQVSENDSHPSSKERWDVFHDDESGSKLANDPGKLSPQPAASSGDACSLAGVGQILTGEPAADDVDRLELLGSDCADVIVSGCFGPMSFEHLSAEVILFNLP